MNEQYLQAAVYAVIKEMVCWSYVVAGGSVWVLEKCDDDDDDE